MGERTPDGTAYEAARLTFDPGTGDTPDDWYVVYRFTATGWLVAASVGG